MMKFQLMSGGQVITEIEADSRGDAAEEALNASGMSLFQQDEDTDTTASLFKKALDTWGEDAQVRMLFEEMSELQKELCKAYRTGGLHTRAQRILEEMVDVEIMMEQLKEIIRPSYQNFDIAYDYEKKRKLRYLNEMLIADNAH